MTDRLDEIRSDLEADAAASVWREHCRYLVERLEAATATADDLRNHQATIKRLSEDNDRLTRELETLRAAAASHECMGYMTSQCYYPDSGKGELLSENVRFGTRRRVYLGPAEPIQETTP